MPQKRRALASPQALVKQRLKAEIVRLRSAGLSYGAIAEHVDRSHTYVRRLCEEAFREAALLDAKETRVALGLELERLDLLTRAAWRTIGDPAAATTAKLRAMEIARRCSESRVRWLRLAQVPDRSTPASRSDIFRSELAGLSDAQLDAELAVLGVTFAAA